MFAFTCGSAGMAANALSIIYYESVMADGFIVLKIKRICTSAINFLISSRASIREI
ncbi:MAG: hypothetical protein ABI723_21535 [Bacteroidia bacterium]